MTGTHVAPSYPVPPPGGAAIWYSDGHIEHYPMFAMGVVGIEDGYTARLTDGRFLTASWQWWQTHPRTDIAEIVRHWPHVMSSETYSEAAAVWCGEDVHCAACTHSLRDHEVLGPCRACRASTVVICHRFLRI